jgi:MFS family permease
MRDMFRALRSRNYRLFFVGQTLSLIGTWMQGLAMSWLVYRMTGSAFLLGTVTFAQQIPMFLVSPVAGVFTDRVDRRKLLILTQSLQAAQALVLSVLVLAHVVQVWEVMALSVFVGVVNAFDTPGRQAFVIEMVDSREMLPNAIALNSTQFNIARLIGPAVAGLTIRFTGEGLCFLINAISFLAVIVSLSMIRVSPRAPRSESQQAWEDFIEGARYVWAHQAIRSLLLLLAAVSFVSGSYQVLLPVYAKTIYRGDSATLGWLYAAVGAGALVSAVLLASRKSVVGLGRWIVGASATFSIGLGVFGLTSNVWLGFLVLSFVGFGAMLHMGSTNTLIQTVVEDRMRGRVMAFYAMSFVGTMPMGSLITGAVSQSIGPIVTLVGSGVLGVFATFMFYRSLPELRKTLRAIYVSKGIMQAEQT